MTRSLIVLTIGWAIMMSSCTDAPKANNMATREDVAAAKLSTAPEDPVAKPIEKKKEAMPEIEAPKPVEKKKKGLVNKQTPKPAESKPFKKKTVTKPATVAVSKKFANISFDKLIHEFGEIDEGDKITHKFKFKNTGNGPLVIDNVDVSCGCTMPTYPIIPIGPGETGEIGVIYNSKGKFGTQKPSITIKTNATQPIVKLYMSGSIKHVFEKPEADTTDTKG